MFLLLAARQINLRVSEPEKQWRRVPQAGSALNIARDINSCRTDQLTIKCFHDYSTISESSVSMDCTPKPTPVA